MISRRRVLAGLPAVLARRVSEAHAQRRVARVGWLSYIAQPDPLLEHVKNLARFVDRILKGADANTMPIEQVNKVGLTINMAAAKALGLTVPQPLLFRAERLIE